MMDFNSIKRIVEGYFNGQYEVEKFLGEGSFSNVYLVKHNFLDDLRAMKIIKEPLNPTSPTETIFNEVKLATKLRNDNIINIYDAGIISAADDLAYFVMEYVPGGDLEDYLNSFAKSNIQMPISRALKIMKQILTGLNTLHSSNPPIVHRDLKLNNILLNYNSNGDIEIKISDFGVAKELTTNLSDIDIVGTRPYMAPESFKKNISPMTDIYAVGVIFYQLLTGHYPYDVEKFSLNELLDLKPWQEGLTPPSNYNERIPFKVDEMVCKCLNVDPEDRYQNAGELLGEVELLMNQMELHDDYDDGEEFIDDYSEYVVNDSILEAFRLAKMENGLSDAIVMLEREILKDYDVRRFYGQTLRIWKSKNPDARLVSKAFTVNLKGRNYNLARDLLREAIAYNPSLESKYEPYIRLWKIFDELSRDSNLIRAVLGLEDLMESSSLISGIYRNIIHVLKTYSIEEIASESLRLVDRNNLIDAANLMEFAVVCDLKMRNELEYKLSLCKQNMGFYYETHDVKGDAIDYAIDLGTVDSIVSYYNEGEPIIIKNHLTGKDVTPSAVLVDDDGVQVGEAARNALLENNQNAITEFKQDMGFSIPFKSKSNTLYPEQLSSEVLKDLRLSVYRQCNIDMDQAVICVPANSNPLKTKAIMDAAELAGFRSYNLLFEPIAVAMAYDLANSNDDYWMIYDLGGGTFNVSVIKKDNGRIEKYVTDGLNGIGGNVFDWMIVENAFAPKIINDLHLADFKRDNPKYVKIFSRLKDACEQAKMELSRIGESEICVGNLFDGYDFTYRLSREEFKQIITPSIESTFKLCHDLLNTNDLEISEMDKIILVGGS
ncbi:MAG: Hsp70 family protein [Methanobrevibacter sp.]|nr:Hsp70 family protein [Methanobrevibacter sp.]